MKITDFKHLTTGVRAVIIGSVFLIGLLVSSVTIGGVFAKSISNDKDYAPNFPINENGQSYGSVLNATSPDTEPDLIKAYGEDGTIGYVKSEDLNGEMPKTPEEALSKQRSKTLRENRQIPLYDINGKTVIGKFNVAHGNGKVIDK